MKNYTVSQVKNIINTNFTEFKAHDITELKGGDNNFVFRVNNEYIFRFPKHLEAERTVKTEFILLHNLKSYVNTLIPNFEFIGNQQQIYSHNYANYSKAKILKVFHNSISSKIYNLRGLDKRFFVGYKEIKGVQLSNELLQRLPSKTKEGIAEEIGNFLFSLNSFPVEKAQEIGIIKWDFTEKYYQYFYEIFTKYVKNELPFNEQDLLNRLFREFINEPNNWAYTPSLIHGDISYDHIIFNSLDNKLSGIIDFGGIAIGDPAYDFCGIYSDYGKEFLELILKSHDIYLNQQLLQKLQILFLCNAVYRVMIGKEKRKKAILQRGWGEIKAMILHLQK
jgi:aminoglycoside 2''-phosphotransferase